MHLLPFEAFPPPTATVAGTNPVLPWARVTVPAVSSLPVHREPCLLTLSLSSIRRAFRCSCPQTVVAFGPLDS
jgi:hypothetical protein